MKPIGRLAVLGVLLLLPDFGSTQIKPEAPAKELSDLYPLKSVFLTYIPLTDLRSILGDKSKFAAVATTPQRERALTIFVKFLKDHMDVESISRSIAFLLLDLNTKKAGFKRLIDKDGVVTIIAWSEVDVLEIAHFAHRHLLNQNDYERKSEFVRKGQVTIPKAWIDLEQLKQDPHISNERVAKFAADFRVLIESKPAEFKDLKVKDSNAYEQIDKFRAVFDRTTMFNPADYKLMSEKRAKLFQDWLKLGDKEIKMETDILKAIDPTKTDIADFTCTPLQRIIEFQAPKFRPGGPR